LPLAPKYLNPVTSAKESFVISFDYSHHYLCLSTGMFKWAGNKNVDESHHGKAIFI
jgi:hypothetical protein